MGNPSISVRKGYRVVPEPFAEETNTVVVTSKDGYFVDVRIHSAAEDAGCESSVQWAFAGVSKSSNPQTGPEGKVLQWHNVWEHHIDSHSTEPEKEDDSADMIVQPDGLVLEKGKNVDDKTGDVKAYEELWGDLDIEAMGTKGKRSSLVVRTEHTIARGRVVKVGGYCQGIVRDEQGRITVERWQKMGSAGSEAGDESTRTRNDWVRTFRCGTAILPCKAVCSNTDGKMGGSVVMKDENGVQWRVVEEYYF